MERVIQYLQQAKLCLNNYSPIIPQEHSRYLS